MNGICESCDRATGLIREPCDNPESPYSLCSECHSRLLARTLRPIEWYNLAKRHGWWQFLLHDDFYEEDGSAMQPERNVDEPESWPSPTLADTEGDSELLLDYTITRWHFVHEIRDAWRKMDSTDVLNAITSRYSQTQNDGIKSAILDVASTQKSNAEEFTRYAWGDYPSTVDLPSIAKATAECLPFDEGFSRVVNALDELDDKQKRELMHSLFYFHDPKTLDWIANNISSPITENWGRLAAASRFTWDDAESWIISGRPLSLVSLDALAAIIRPQSPLLRDYGPKLIDPPSSDTLTNVLESHAKCDDSPRVERITNFILNNTATLING